MRFSPQPDTVYAEGLATVLAGWTPGRLLCGDHVGEIESTGDRAIQQTVVQDRSDGSILHLIDSRQGAESILFANRYRPEFGYINDLAVVWVARRDSEDRIVDIAHWRVEHRSQFFSFENDAGPRILPRRIILATGNPILVSETVSSGRTPDLLDTGFFAEWELQYDAGVEDIDSLVEEAVERHLKRQWDALESIFESEEYRRLNIGPRPESVDQRQAFPQLITDRRFYQEGVATSVYYRWSRPLPADDVIQKAAHTPGQSYLDPADRPPAPPGTPGGSAAPAAAGSASPASRPMFWRWVSWSFAGAILILAAVLRLRRGGASV
jgi:hypothetical protein